MKKIFALIAITILNLQIFSQCNGRYEYEIFSNVNKTSVNYSDVYTDLAHEMDIYTPQGDIETNRPLIIYMHGGSFYLGDKSMTDCVDFCESFAKRGYVCASINYRLSNIFSFLLSQDVQLETVLKAVADANAAVRFFRKDVAENGNSFGIDPETIFAGGYSAGAVIAIHQGFISDISELPPNIQNLTNVIGGTIEGNSGNNGYSSKISGVISLAGGIHDYTWIDSYETPIVSVQGTNDNTINYYCAPALNNPAVVDLCGAGEIHPQADLVGLHNDKLIFNGEGHSWAANGNSNQLFSQALDFYSSFLYPLLPCNNISSDKKNNIINPKKIVKIVDILGKEIKNKNCSVLFYIYDDGTVKKVFNNHNL
tara:strand:- start:3358 stop:4461 length:1104 start_codon:yes stop_codon:yes gene_type:complete